MAQLLGGAWLVVLGGSWYYALSGLALFFSAVQLFRRKVSGAYIFAAILAATVLWTLYERGWSYWAWVPRLDVLLIAALFLCVLLPKLENGPSRKVSLNLAGVCAGVIAVCKYSPKLKRNDPMEGSGNPWPEAGAHWRCEPHPVFAKLRPSRASILKHSGPSVGDAPRLFCCL